MSQARFQKRMREKARQEKQAMKRERREQRAAEAAAAAEAGDDEPSGPPQERVLAKLAELHQQFDDEQIDFDEFEERKAELIAQLTV